MNVLAIKDNKPGHFNQTEGLLLQLKEIYTNLNVEYIEVDIKSKFTRKVLRVLLNNFDLFFQKKENLRYLNFFYKNIKLPKNKPDLILSTGGNTSNLNAWISKAYNCKNILNGALRGLNEELFTHVTTVIDLGYRNQIILDVAPSIITKEELEKSSLNFLKEKKLDSTKKYYSLLIGGDGSGYKYDDKFYDDLIDFVKTISIKDNINWLITTSRRTPIDIEIKLQNSLKHHSSYFVAYNKKEEKILLAFLGLSEKVFVMEESSSMISEAISSLKPVFTLSSNANVIDKNYLKILKKFAEKKLIHRISDFKYNKITFDNVNNMNTGLKTKLKDLRLVK